jgi:hypothetical protein
MEKDKNGLATEEDTCMASKPRKRCPAFQQQWSAKSDHGKTQFHAHLLGKDVHSWQYQTLERVQVSRTCFVVLRIKTMASSIVSNCATTDWHIPSPPEFFTLYLLKKIISLFHDLDTHLLLYLAMALFSIQPGKRHPWSGVAQWPRYSIQLSIRWGNMKPL